MSTKVITGITSTGSIGTLTVNIINGPVSGARTALVAAELRIVYMNRKPTSRDRIVYANED